MNSCRSGFIGKALMVRLLFVAALVGLITVCVSSDYAFAEFKQLFKKKRIVYEEVKEEAKDEAKDNAKRVPLARCLGKKGSVLILAKGSSTWRPAKQEEELFAGDLIISGAGVSIENLDKTVKLTFRGDLAGTSPLPIRETAIRLLPKKEGCDFSVDFERGRIELTNTKEKGSVKCSVTLFDDEDHGQVVLNEPGSTCAMEELGRWPKGTHFNPLSKEEVKPVYDLIYVALKGTSEVSDHGVTHFMSAPPGPAMLSWNSADGSHPIKSKLEKLPEWTLPPDLSKPIVRDRMGAVLKIREQFLAEKPLPEILSSMAISESEADRFIAINLILATDQLDLFFKSFVSSKNYDVIENGIIGLRHWIGRKPGQDLKLYEFVISSRHYTKKQAEIFIDLLHSFGDDELKEPETFEALIGYLGSDKTGIRALANWHLHRLVPKGRDIKFDTLANEAERKEAIAKWKKLVPKGTVPSRSIS
ncbi:MAG: hypothetical protein NTV50_01715 [Planctomycetota bacterium]|nr:hypothetical protein [Planctomycetota bacterium]